MCCKKKLLELSYIFKKIFFYSRSFLVINVCNQGKTLCSHCIIRYLYPKGVDDRQQANLS